MLNSLHERSTKIRFGNKLPDRIYTGKEIKGKDGSAVKIELVDVYTGLIDKYGPKSSARVEIVALRVDGDNTDRGLWSVEKLNGMVETRTEDNKLLLKGQTRVNLNEGTALVDMLWFIHTSKPKIKCEYMLGVGIVDDSGDGVVMIEANSNIFTLLDKRNEPYKKNDSLALDDYVWCLQGISKKGERYKRLKEKGITTVKDLLIQIFRDLQRLREILRTSSDGLDFKLIIKHALSCMELERKSLYYAPNSQQQFGVVFNKQLLGVLFSHHFIPIGSMPTKQKIIAKKLIASALENWYDVVPYDEACLFSDSSQLIHVGNSIASTSGNRKDVIHSNEQSHLVSNEYTLQTVGSDAMVGATIGDDYARFIKGKYTDLYDKSSPFSSSSLQAIHDYKLWEDGVYQAFPDHEMQDQQYIITQPTTTTNSMLAESVGDVVPWGIDCDDFSLSCIPSASGILDYAQIITAPNIILTDQVENGGLEMANTIPMICECVGDVVPGEELSLSPISSASVSQLIATPNVVLTDEVDYGGLEMVNLFTEETDHREYLDGPIRSPTPLPDSLTAYDTWYTPRNEDEELSWFDDPHYNLW